MQVSCRTLFTPDTGFMSATPAASSSLQAALSYCVKQVRSYDYHHLHLPPAMRKAAFTFRAFNVETAKAMDVLKLILLQD
ncbi:hypothetical protein PVAP13_8KG111601 [Panicum virgatum]|uniref:Uncharacterized protein n=1 Tax=Panicum virgatum TaxID=38727 RepID=A0A8T0PFU1_PANVG|nr:hypothetical protein PVAP13_8KG111601 [Panicum virgatum]